MHREGDRLGPAEVFVLGPDIFDFDWLNARRQRRGLRRIEKIFDAIGKATEATAPIDFQALVDDVLREQQERTRKT